MTPIQPVPALRLSSRFPTNADRPSGQWNSVVVEWGTTTRTMSSDLHLVAQNVLNNATAARELAEAAQASNAQALVQADRARDESDQAMGYRNTAGAHAATATAQAGIATTQAQDAAASAAHANADKLATQQIAQQAVTDTGEQVGLATAQAERAREAAESVAYGPIRSLAVYSGLKTGAVTLGLSDMGPQATEVQMQAGTGTEPLLMSPAAVKVAVLAHAPEELLRSARTSNVQLVKADAGKFIDITSGTFTQTFAAAATLGSGWWCYLKNSGKESIDVPINGGFDTDSGWNKGSGWAITGGKAVATSSASYLSPNQDSLVIGKKYKLTLEVTVTSGGFEVFSGGTLGNIYDSGVQTYEFTATNRAFRFSSLPGSFTGTLDNVTLTELTTCDVTLDPSGSESIDGLNSFVMYPGEMRLVQCDGVSLNSFVLNGFHKVFRESGLFIKPPGYSRFEGLLWQGGSAGYPQSGTSEYFGGKGGDCFPIQKYATEIQYSTLVQIGAGGAAGSGGLGGHSFFGNISSEDAIYSGIYFTNTGSFFPYRGGATCALAGNRNTTTYGGAAPKEPLHNSISSVIVLERV